MYLREADAATRQMNESRSFELSPPTLSKTLDESIQFSNATPHRDRLDPPDLTDNFDQFHEGEYQVPESA